MAYRDISRRALILVLAGAPLGAALDRCHVAVGAIGYREPALFGLAWWVPLIYAGAALAMGLGAPALDRALGRRDRFPLTVARLAAGFLALAAIWVGSGALPLRGLALDAALATGALVTWWMLDRTAGGLAIAAGAAIGGFAIEATLVRRGLFFYRSRQDLLGVASWLPWLYVAGSVAVGNAGRRLAQGAVAEAPSARAVTGSRGPAS